MLLLMITLSGEMKGFSCSPYYPPVLDVASVIYVIQSATSFCCNAVRWLVTCASGVGLLPYSYLQPKNGMKFPPTNNRLTLNTVRTFHLPIAPCTPQSQ